MSLIFEREHEDPTSLEDGITFVHGGSSKPKMSWLATWRYSIAVNQEIPMMCGLNHIPDVRLQAIELLFGMDEALVKQWPGLQVVCSSLEAKFEGLLRDEFNAVWKILKRRKPTDPREGWHWCLAVLRGFQALRTPASGESGTMEKVYQHLTEGRPGEFSPSDKERILLAVFAVLCWTSMTLDPDLELDQPDQSTAGNNRNLSFHAKGIIRKDECSNTTVSQFAKRPITKVFRGLRGALEGSSGYAEPGVAAGAAETGTIYESSVNFSSLYTVGRVRINWVQDLASHLVFDRQFRTLSVFCLPSFCVGSILRTQQLTVLQQVTSELLPPRYNTTNSVDSDGSSLHREVLLSYRLLFGQSARSRKLSRKLLGNLKGSMVVDPFLRTVCSTRIAKSHFLRRFSKPQISHQLFPASNLDLDNSLVESDTYSSQDDFPYFGSRLLAIQQYNLRQQPSRIRDLWRDRRNPMQWYTFWAVVWVGGITIVLSLLQLAATIVQTYYSVK